MQSLNSTHCGRIEGASRKVRGHRREKQLRKNLNRSDQIHFSPRFKNRRHHKRMAECPSKMTRGKSSQGSKTDSRSIIFPTTRTKNPLDSYKRVFIFICPFKCCCADGAYCSDPKNTFPTIFPASFREMFPVGSNVVAVFPERTFAFLRASMYGRNSELGSTSSNEEAIQFSVPVVPVTSTMSFFLVSVVPVPVAPVSSTVLALCNSRPIALARILLASCREISAFGLKVLSLYPLIHHFA